MPILRRVAWGGGAAVRVERGDEDAGGNDAGAEEHEGQCPEVVGDEEEDADVVEGEERRERAADRLGGLHEQSAAEHARYALAAEDVDCEIFFFENAKQTHCEICGGTDQHCQQFRFLLFPINREKFWMPSFKRCRIVLVKKDYTGEKFPVGRRSHHFPLPAIRAVKDKTDRIIFRTRTYGR